MIKKVYIIIGIPGIARASVEASDTRLSFDLDTDDTSDSGSIPFCQDSLEKLAGIISETDDSCALTDDTTFLARIETVGGVTIDFNADRISQTQFNKLIDRLCDTSQHLEFFRGFTIR